MSALWLIRLPLDPAALGRWSAGRGLGWVTRRSRGGEAAHYDEGAALHHFLGEAFGPGAVQPFRLMVPPGVGRASLYGYSRQDGAALSETARTAMLPEALAVADPARLQAKPMPGAWRAGQRLGFDLRLRPVVRLAAALEAKDGRLAKGAEVDAFLAEALRRHPKGQDGMAAEGRNREAVYRDWLAARLAGVAGLEEARLVRFQRVRAARQGRAVEGPDAVIQGTLAVRDPEAFSAALAGGIGRHRAYGYGMLLLRPPGARAPSC